MKNFLYWFFAVIITLSAVVYQRVTGPTNPKRVTFLLENREYKTKFTRSLETHVTLEDASKGNFGDYMSNVEFQIDSLPKETIITIKYRRYPGEDTLKSVTALYNNGKWQFTLPSQPPAGKLIYYPVINHNGSEQILEEHEGIVVRFKSPVPAFVLIPHILLMFIAMLLANYSGITSYLATDKSVKYAGFVILTLGVGGLILGPVVQKYAFGSFWTGWPFGEDLTDNKTLVAFVVWVVAYLINKKTRARKYLLIIAAIVTLIVYSIPHSTAGSEYDYNKGAVVTGR
jgi:hypothetical protein